MTPHNKNNTQFTQTTLQPTVSLTFPPKISHVTKRHTFNKPKHPNGNDFSSHNYQFFF